MATPWIKNGAHAHADILSSQNLHCIFSISNLLHRGATFLETETSFRGAPIFTGEVGPVISISWSESPCSPARGALIPRGPDFILVAVAYPSLL